MWNFSLVENYSQCVRTGCSCVTVSFVYVLSCVVFRRNSCILPTTGSGRSSKSVLVPKWSIQNRNPLTSRVWSSSRKLVLRTFRSWKKSIHLCQKEVIWNLYTSVFRYISCNSNLNLVGRSEVQKQMNAKSKIIAWIAEIRFKRCTGYGKTMIMENYYEGRWN